MRCGHDAHVDRRGTLAAHALECAVLQNTQQADLRRWRQLAAFVEEQGAAVGPLEPAFAVADRAGEAAALVAKELRIHQLGRNRPAVDAQERPGRAPRTLVNRPRDDLLA